MSLTIRKSTLVKLGACAEQLHLFNELFGDKVTYKSFEAFLSGVRYYANKFDFSWAVNHLLDVKHRQLHYMLTSYAYIHYKEGHDSVYTLHSCAHKQLAAAMEVANADMPDAFDALNRAMRPLNGVRSEALRRLSVADRLRRAEAFAICYWKQKHRWSIFHA